MAQRRPVKMPFPHFPGDRFSGTWKKSIVAYEWRGRQCVRTYVVPRNPRTRSQQRNRGRFAAAVRAWRSLSPDRKKALDRQAQAMSGYNLFIRKFMMDLRLPW